MVSNLGVSKTGSNSLLLTVSNGTPVISRQSKEKSNHISTGSGLNHIRLACEGCGGDFDYGFKQKEGIFSLVLRLPAMVVGADEGPTSTNEAPDTGPCVCPPSSGGHNSWCAGLKICAIDDSAVLCKGYERLLLPQLSSGEDSVVCCPDTQESIARFMEQVTGSSPVEAARGEGDPLAAKPADIVILDQHIDNVQCFDNEAGEVRLKRFLSLTRPQQQLS